VLNSEIICVYKYLKQNSELFDFIILSDPKKLGTYGFTLVKRVIEEI